MLPRVATKWNQTDQFTKQKQIKLLLNKNGYQQGVVNKTIYLRLKNLDTTKTIGPEKCVVTFKIPFIHKSSEMLETKIRQLMKLLIMQQTQDCLHL